MENIIKNHFHKSSSVIKALIKHENKIKIIVQDILGANQKGNKILVAGNGGSCADAEHFTGELTCTFSNRERKPISALSLSSFPAAITAWSNDFGYNTFVKRQIEANGKQGDILILLSTGGGDEKAKHSLNLIEAAKVAKKEKIKVVSLIGKNGGVLKKISDLNILVKSYDTAFIQEAHMSILHCICACLDKKLSK